MSNRALAESESTCFICYKVELMLEYLVMEPVLNNNVYFGLSTNIDLILIFNYSLRALWKISKRTMQQAQFCANSVRF